MDGKVKKTEAVTLFQLIFRLSFHVFLVSIDKDRAEAQIFRYSCRRDAAFKLVATDAKLDAITSLHEQIRSLSICAKVCLDNAACTCFNYHFGLKHCEILTYKEHIDGLLNLTSAAGWKHYKPALTQRSPICRTKINHQVCQPTAKCIDSCESPNGYTCQALSNIARGKAATQWVDYVSRAASRAVDGNANTIWRGGSCTHANPTTSNNPWWRVDFGKLSAVYAVRITNRGDCCGGRLASFNIRVGDSSTGSGDENVLCKVNVGVGQGLTAMFPCDPVLYGRYLYVQSNLNQVLTLCEVEVFGEIL